MRTRRQRNADIKLMLAATVAVLLAGFVIAAGIYIASTSDDTRATCGRLPIGSADSIRDDLERAGPSFQSGGANCSFWLALQDGDIVAYAVNQPDGCVLDIEREEFVCDDGPVEVETLAQYPVSIVTRDDVDTLLVDLTTDSRSTTTSTTTSTSVPST